MRQKKVASSLVSIYFEYILIALNFAYNEQKLYKDLDY